MLEKYSFCYNISSPTKCSLKIKLPDELFDSLNIDGPSTIYYDFQDDINSITVENKIYNFVIDSDNKIEQTAHKDELLNLFNIEYNTKNSIIVKGPPSIIDFKNDIDNKYLTNTHSNDNNNNRKRFSSQIPLENDYHSAKRQAISKNIKSVDFNNKEAKPFQQSSILSKTVINLLTEGKTVAEVAKICAVSENIVKELISGKSEVNKDSPKETTIKSDQKRLGSSIRTPEKAISKPIKERTLNTSFNSDFSKLKMTLDSDILNNKDNKIVFIDNKSLHGISDSIMRTERHKRKSDLDFNNNNTLTKSATNTNLIKPPTKSNEIINKLQSKENTIKTIPLVVKQQPVVTKPMIKENRVTSSQKELAPQNRNGNLFTEPNKKPTIDNYKKEKQVVEQPKPLPTSHYPTEPYSKTQDETLVKKIALTEPKVTSKEIKYRVVDPKTVNFQPNKNPKKDLENRNPETEDFRNEVLEAFHRLQDCHKIYRRYNEKRESLKERARKSRTRVELDELYSEYYQLVEEEKESFFLDLQNEIIILQDKLFEISRIMDVKIV